MTIAAHVGQTRVDERKPPPQTENVSRVYEWQRKDRYEHHSSSRFTASRFTASVPLVHRLRGRGRVQVGPRAGGLGSRIEEAVELIEMELRHAIAYVNDAVIPQVRQESISAMRSVADTLRNLADRIEQRQRPPKHPNDEHRSSGTPPKGPQTG